MSAFFACIVRTVVARVRRDMLGRARNERLLGHLSFAKMVDAQIPGDGDDPATELVAVPKLANPLETLDERILSDILGVVDVAQHAETDQEDMLIVPADQSGVRRPIPLARGRHQVFVAAFVQSRLRIQVFTRETPADRPNYRQSGNSARYFESQPSENT